MGRWWWRMEEEGRKWSEKRLSARKVRDIVQFSNAFNLITKLFRGYTQHK